MRKLLTSMVLASVLGPAAIAGANASPSSPAKAAAPERNIVQTANAAGDFKTLTALVQSAGLTDALSGNSKFTVFAPTDAAFKKVPKAALAKLLANRAQLRRVLLYHVLPGDVKAAAVVQLRSARTLAGPRVRIRVANGKVYLNTSTRVVKTDIAASNGTIHVINRVLLPPGR